jgi:uncharacterized protein (DUF302 family)
VAIALFLALVGLAMTIYLISLRGSAHSSGSNSRNNQEEMPMSQTAPATDDGIMSKPSNHSVDETVEKLKAILQAKGVTLFALVDHGGEAAKVGLKMPPTKLLIFGNPKGGTPLMLAAPSIAIDLPLKFWSRKTAREKSGFPIIARRICSSGRACRRRCFRT